jgi:hypothetical protein
MSYFGVTVEGIPSVDRVLDVMEKAGKQLPFAISLAVNKTAEALRVFEVEKQIPSKLTVRNKWPLARGEGNPGINKTFASKAKPESTVGSSAWWLEGVEKGKIKTPRRGKNPQDKGKVILVPAQDIRQKEKRLVATNVMPWILMGQSTAAFFLPSSSGPVMFTRIGPGKRDLRAWFFGKKQTTVKKMLDYEPAGEEYVLKIYPKMFGDALGQALATAK